MVAPARTVTELGSEGSLWSTRALDREANLDTGRLSAAPQHGHAPGWLRQGIYPRGRLPAKRCPRQESNLHPALRRRVLCPLSYEGRRPQGSYRIVFVDQRLMLGDKSLWVWLS